MAKTLLNGLNEIFKRVSLIAGDAGALTSLTDSARQTAIDQGVQVINEANDELFTVSEIPMPNEQAESTLVLVTGTRAYTLATDLVQLRWPMIDKTNSQLLQEYPGGYNAMLLGDMEQDDAGLPQYGVVRPTDSKLHLDRAPSSAENGRIYTYQYDKDLVLDEAADNFPFRDAVFRAMVPVYVQLFKRENRNEFDEALYRVNLGRASRVLTQRQPRESYSPR
jgi:hypothetical protein